MFRNYVKIALRNLRKYPGYSFINIGGLAVGIAVAMIIGLWIFDELSYESYHKNRDKIARVMQNETFNGIQYTSTSIPAPLADELQKLYGSDFRHIVLSSWTGDHILTFGETKLTKSGIYMQADAPSLLSLTMVKGSVDGLREPGSIMLSESVATTIFGDKDPMNQLMQIDNKLDVKVTGIYEDIPVNSDFKNITFIAPWSLYESSDSSVKKAREENRWGYNAFQLFVQIADHADMKVLSEKIKKHQV